jgi:ssDNA-binding replication factor A large subunit
MLVKTGNVKVIGEVVSLTSRTGAFFRCPECRRTVKNGICTVHGEVEPIKDLRIGLRIITRFDEVVLEFSGEKAQKIAGVNAEDAHSRSRQELWNHIEKRFVGNTLKAECFSLKDNYLYAKEAELLEKSE